MREYSCEKCHPKDKYSRILWTNVSIEQYHDQLKNKFIILPVEILSFTPTFHRLVTQKFRFTLSKLKSFYLNKHAFLRLTMLAGMFVLH